MALIEERLRDHLLGDATIAGLVVARIYPGVLSQTPVFPAIVYNKISALRDDHHSGISGLARPRIQIDSWAQSYGVVKSLAEAVRLRLQAFSGLVTDVEIGGVQLVDERDDFAPEVNNYRVIQEFIVWHSEATS